ncbi:hypothetical protein D5F01_LYC22553 [Larimichthys crocea]|uniref:Uncharacterized protein n=1 Tax=Larimichthys crocea TaxID=215358 RepID=A0A6G0HIW4_LARCR|nr:hypothetical protein D5F01_LYC22553 [Larimichthys crocea]
MGNSGGHKEDFFSDAPSVGYLSFENNPQPQSNRRKAAGAYKPAPQPQFHLPVHRTPKRRQDINDFGFRPPYHFQPYYKPCYVPYYGHHHQYVMRSRQTRIYYCSIHPTKTQSLCPSWPLLLRQCVVKDSDTIKLHLPCYLLPRPFYVLCT